MNARQFLRVYIVPGAVFQSVMIGGGYGTGRELVEYFTRFGIVGGLLGLTLATVVFAVLLGATYEFARAFQAYDYRTLIRSLLGRAWIGFELSYILLLVIVLAVVGAAAGEILQQQFAVPLWIGVGFLLSAVAIIAFLGREWVTNLLASWALVLYVVFIAYFLAVVLQYGDRILTALNTGEAISGWAIGGIRYALYSSAVIPAVLFATRDITTTRQAFVSGALSSLIAMIPAVLFHLSFAAGYPAVVQEKLPTYWMLGRLGLPVLVIIYMIALLGTLVQTGIGMIQGLIERLEGWQHEKRKRKLLPYERATAALACMAVSGVLSTFGIIRLIAAGYGTLAWGFLLFYVAPMLTFGMYRVWRAGSQSRSIEVARP